MAPSVPRDLNQGQASALHLSILEHARAAHGVDVAIGVFRRACGLAACHVEAARVIDSARYAHRSVSALQSAAWRGNGAHDGGRGLADTAAIGS